MTFDLRFFGYFGFILIPIACFPFFSDPYFDAKWNFAYAITFLITGVAWVQKKRPFQIPKISSLELIGLLAIFFSSSISVLFNLPGFYENQILDWLCFGMLVLFSFNHEPSHLIFKWNQMATYAVLGFGILQWLGFQPFPAIETNDFPASFFGFQNMTAEFIGISILCQFYSIFKGYTQKRAYFLIAASILYVWLLECRSAIVALTLAVLVWVVLIKNKQTQRILALLVAILTIISISFVSLRGIPHPSWINPRILEIKSGNTNLRLIRWANTWEMIRKNPWGVGPGKYEFAYIPYSRIKGPDIELGEFTLIRSPHNAYLQLAVQYGIETLFLVLFGIGLFLKRFFSKKLNLESTFLTSFFLFIGIDAIFAFPLENAYPFYVTAIFFGWGLRLCEFHQINIKEHWLRKGLVCAMLISGLGSGLFFFSKYAENNELSFSQVTLACHLFPSNWRTCAKMGNMALEEGDSHHAEEIARFLLTRSPYNFIAQRILGEALIRQGKTNLGCDQLLAYDQLFGMKSSIHVEVTQKCLDKRD